jgi:hypothetical protein
MIWRDGVDYNGSNFNASWGISKDVLDAYLAGAKNADPLDPDNKSKWHHASVNMSYATQTSSEFFQLNTATSGKDGLVKIGWDQFDSDGLNNNVTWKTSLEYLLTDPDGAGPLKPLSTKSLSTQYDRTASIEFMKNNFATKQEALNYLNSITSMELHLSDEARGLPSFINPIPEPGSAAALMGLLSCGLFLRSRRTRTA